MNELQYISTRGSTRPLDFEGCLLTGLAADGGLFVPATWPRLSNDEIAEFADMTYEDVAVRVIGKFTGNAFSERELAGMTGGSYENFAHSARAPLVQLDRSLFLMELFHGPTLAFKDFAMQLVGRMFDAALRKRGERTTIVGATSGDTGSAAIEAFRGLPAADVFILFPHGRVSDVQRLQMTTPDDENVHAMAVEGDFDDCQALVKGMFNKAKFREEMRLGAVNSINWARIVAQVVYFFTSATALGAPGRSVDFVVPTGNFGDIFSGFVARTMGLPINRLVVATNQNDILHRALRTGTYTKATVAASISPSMDIQVSSNFERAFFEATGRNAESVRVSMERLKTGGFEISNGAIGELRKVYESGSCSERQTLASIGRTFSETGHLVCPHTAVGLKVGRELPRERGVPIVSLATAHPAKFPDAVKQATGVMPKSPERLARLHGLPERVTTVPNDLGKVMAFVRERVTK